MLLHVGNPTSIALWRFALGPLAAQCYQVHLRVDSGINLVLYVHFFRLTAC